MNQFSKNAGLWLVIIVLISLAYNYTAVQDKGPDRISYSDFTSQVSQGIIAEVKIRENKIEGTYLEGLQDDRQGSFITYPPPADSNLVPLLREHGVKFDGMPKEEDPWYFIFLQSILPFIIIIGLWFLIWRQFQAGGGKALSFGKSKARLLEEDALKVTFSDVAGIEESKSDLESIVKFLKDPKKFTKLGGRIPKGVLLVGSPGTGKTLLAKAIAGEAGVPFFSISGSDFVEMFVGVGASRVRDLFLKGKKNAPCIILIDEIDAVGRHRGAGLGGGHDEREQTLNQLLVEMDGFEANEGVILIAATNRSDVLDPALLRPGRFDRQVVVPLPDIKGRSAILAVHTKKVPISKDVDIEKIARGTPGFAGADLANLVNEAALWAALQDAEEVTMAHFEYAKDKIMMGAERRSMVLSDKEKEITAYHEAGHALIAKLLPTADPVHKVTIVPRGVALGLMQQLPEDDKHTYPKQYWLDRICIAFGGRIAEELVFDQITTGAQSDISMATNVARKMVCEWGMSDALGPLAYGRKDDAVFLGREIGHQRDYSEATAFKIDEEVKSIVTREMDRARKLIGENKVSLERMSKALLKVETLDGSQVDAIMRGEEIPDPDVPLSSSNPSEDNSNTESQSSDSSEVS
ncbi:MAG TPA: ATP-dependent zinc metalloprotease FtsH [Oligoflexia bacterium]|nr:ATP-dependent zinc metalloprotease FtsH [Oligoflexia bacterium]HMP48613.1 ATP-dependent zinc metalloprotease FtsH [Oligoflexia bacterium]